METASFTSSPFPWEHHKFCQLCGKKMYLNIGQETTSIPDDLQVKFKDKLQ